MKKILTLIFTLVSICSYASDVDGVVLLDNTTNHSGVLIKFIPVSTSAVYADTTSDQNGYYNYTVISGVYNISFEKNGYQTFVIENQFISTTDITLTEVTLNSNPIVYISGDVSGTWTYGNTYIVIAETTVPENETLIIEPGVEVKFDGYFYLIIEGTLQATGNENNYITFTSAEPTPSKDDWAGIQINNNNTLSELKFCIVEYGDKENDNQTGLIQVKGNILIENSIIRHSEGIGVRGVYTFSGDITIRDSEIYDCKHAIYSSNNGELIVENNSIYDILQIGIRCWSDSEYTSITNNRISDCQVGINVFADFLIERNIFYNNTQGIGVGDGQPSITNNTFFFNQRAISISNTNDIYNPNPIINSNIFYNNSEFVINNDDNTPLLLEYNLFYGNANGIGNNLPAGIGTVVTTNVHGTDSDTYYNIFENPNFLSLDPENLDFCRLAENSKAIDAGDPSIPNLFDSTIVNIGAIEGFGTLSIDDISENHFNVFPNPVTDYIKIQSNDNSRFKRIILYNLTGQIIKDYKLNLHQKEYTITRLDDLKSGLYFVKVFGDNNKVQSIKLLKK